MSLQFARSTLSSVVMTVEMTHIFPLHLQTGLIVACYQGYVDVVIALSQCPYVDVNWQDKEGNTALMTAAQAGKGSGAIQLPKAIKLQSATPGRSPWDIIWLFYETRANICIILRLSHDETEVATHIFFTIGAYIPKENKLGRRLGSGRRQI